VGYLLDTDVVSERSRRRPDPSVTAWLRDARREDLHLSVMTLGELRRGIELLRRRDGRAAGRLEDWLAELVAEYEQRIVPITTEIAGRWGQLNSPDRLPEVDGLLAATALVHGWTLVTRNTADVARTGVPRVNPFRPE
jgi:hypothetical protein